MEPTIFGGVAPSMTVAREEVFGPVLAVQRFEDEAEAVRLANGTVYGLASAVWTSNLARAHRMVRAIDPRHRKRRLQAGSLIRTDACAKGMTQI